MMTQDRQEATAPRHLAYAPAPGESVARRTVRRFRRHRLATVSVVVLLMIVVLAVGASRFQRYTPEAIDLRSVSQTPSASHWLGTDRIGRDVWSRLIHGGRVSLAIGLVSTFVSVTLGILVGATSGYYRGRVDMVLQRITDVAMMFPSIIFMLTLVVFVGAGILNIILIIGGVSWMGVARLIRAEFLAMHGRDYVDAARCIGVGDARIIFKHILPNALAPALAQGAFAVGSAILTEAGLSFLGLGVPPPTPTWGNMLEVARQLEVLRDAPWMWMPPTFMIVVTVLCVNFIGDGLLDMLDPRTLL